MKRLYRWLTSTELAIILLLALSLLALPGTFGESRALYTSAPFVALLALLGGSTLFCTLKKVRTLPVHVVALHAGVVLLLVGGVLTSRGYVATVNIYEGSGVNAAYRWDLAADAPLGFDLMVDKIHREFYPVPVQVGVLKGAEKVALLTVKTGESFSLGDSSVTVDSFDPQERKLKLRVFKRGELVGSTDTSDAGVLPEGYPYRFRLVAFRNPTLKRSWLDLRLLRESRTVAEGSCEVNGPLRWGGLDFFHVQSDRDPQGRGYAGIQIVHDPGRPLVFAGLALLGLGAVLLLMRRCYGKR